MDKDNTTTDFAWGGRRETSTWRSKLPTGFQNRLNEAISHQIQWYESIFRQREMNSGEKKVSDVAAVLEIWLFKST